MSWQNLRGPCTLPAVNSLPSFLAWGQVVMSGIPKGYLSHVSLSRHSSGQLCSPGQATSSQCILDSSTLGTNASDGIGSCREEPGSGKQGPSRSLPDACDWLYHSTPGGTHVSARACLLSPPWFCPSVTLSSPESQSMGGWFDVNWPG